MSIFRTIQFEHTTKLMSEYRTNLNGLSFEQIGSLFSLVKENLNYANRFDKPLVEKTEQYREAIDILNASEVPLAGHRVKLITSNGKVYENAIIDRIDSEGGVHICMNGSAFMYPLSGDVRNLSFSISGGYFAPAPGTKLSPLGRTDGRFWFFGQRACANGGIYITQPIKRWLLDDSKGELGFY
ncbi:MAG: hypothetical protein CL578_05755 [Alteromonadaceae bacterium]|uniref:Uncharacterized protein n=1 Tax=Paraglaciecola agarilytica NO2 TaxID=1125747 RepID=A0ABQ0I201_9ALTE|nr:DUF4121 family protein [Paraglaciecola agarilytica]MBN24537.1 hypothetical protein [Alteromonadaceae bacterium]GAC03341.1 hypothetical protein GAGA_0476 [Paraglaciecola agarilytica NO2]